MRLVDNRLASLPEGEHFDDLLPGFGLRVFPSGKRSFFVRFRGAGRHIRQTIGPYPETSLARARDLARGLIASPRDSAHLTVGAVAELYIRWLAVSGLSRCDHLEQEIRRHLIPGLGAERFQALRRREILRVLEPLAKKYPRTANKIRTRLSAIYTWAIARDMVDINPVRGLPKIAPTTSRDRVASDQELAELWRSKAFSVVLQAHYRMILLTVCRPSEVRGMRWSEISGDWWTIPAARTKIRKEHRVYLSTLAREVLAEIRPHSQGSEFVFLNPATGKPYLTYWASHAIRLAGFTFTPHDLRRTASTILPSLGVQRDLIPLLLGHRDQRTAAIYDRYAYDPQRTDALERLAGHIRKITQP